MVVFGNIETGDKEAKSVRLPILHRRIHSLTLCIRWRDQGFGNRKGQVWIVGRPTNVPFDEDVSFHGGTVVCESPLAEHTMQNYRMTFVPQQGHVYHLFYRIGSGGGHALQMERGILYTSIFDDPQHHTATNYRILRELGAIGPEATAACGFYSQMLLSVAKSLRSQLATGNEPDCALVSMLRQNSIPVNPESMLAIEGIVRIDTEERALACADREEIDAAARAAAAEANRQLWHHHLDLDSESSDSSSDNEDDSNVDTLYSDDDHNWSDNEDEDVDGGWQREEDFYLD